MLLGVSKSLIFYVYGDQTDYVRQYLCEYPLPTDGVLLVGQWKDTPDYDDHFISGLLADWLTDHRSELLIGATNPSDPAVRLDALIDWLRSRFNSVYGR